MLLQLGERRIELGLDTQYRLSSGRIEWQNFAGLVPLDPSAGDTLTREAGMRLELLITCQRCSRKWDHVRIHSDLASSAQTTMGLRRCGCGLLQHTERGSSLAARWMQDRNVSSAQPTM